MIPVTEGYFRRPDFSVMLARYAHDHSLTEEDALRHFKAVSQFLTIAASADGPVAPSKAIDEVWHAFILCTEGYSDFCSVFFGRYIHHRPSPPGVVNGDEYLRTLSLAREHFGPAELDPSFWADPRSRPSSAEGAGCVPGCTPSCEAAPGGQCETVGCYTSCKPD